MPSLVPKQTLYQPPAPPVTPVADLKSLFEGTESAASVARVVAYIEKLHADYSDGSFERVSRPNMITEQFAILMPTEAAYQAEVELCNAIANHAARVFTDEDVKVYLDKYVNTHIFVYEKEVRTVKSGDPMRWQKDIDIYALYADGRCIAVCNAIQMWLVYLIYKRASPDSKFKCVLLP